MIVQYLIDFSGNLALFLALIPEDLEADKHISVHLWPPSGCVWTNLDFQWKHEEREETSKNKRFCVNRYRTFNAN